jgi:hypothetical protein
MPQSQEFRTEFSVIQGSPEGFSDGFVVAAA